MLKEALKAKNHKMFAASNTDPHVRYDWMSSSFCKKNEGENIILSRPNFEISQMQSVDRGPNRPRTSSLSIAVSGSLKRW